MRDVKREIESIAKEIKKLDPKSKEGMIEEAINIIRGELELMDEAQIASSLSKLKRSYRVEKSMMAGSEDILERIASGRWPEFWALGKIQQAAILKQADDASMLRFAGSAQGETPIWGRMFR
jgi:hypothetical protein